MLQNGVTTWLHEHWSTLLQTRGTLRVRWGNIAKVNRKNVTHGTHTAYANNNNIRYSNDWNDIESLVPAEQCDHWCKRDNVTARVITSFGNRRRERHLLVWPANRLRLRLFRFSLKTQKRRYSSLVIRVTRIRPYEVKMLNLKNAILPSLGRFELACGSTPSRQVAPSYAGRWLPAVGSPTSFFFWSGGQPAYHRYYEKKSLMNNIVFLLSW